VARRSGLGRGLGALIPADTEDATNVPEQDAATTELRMVPVSAIHPNKYQPRQSFDEEALSELTSSVRELGVLQPILVRPDEDDTYELIAGERRWRAATRAGLTEIPVITREVEDLGALEQAVVENLHRSDLNPLEEAAAFQQLIDDFDMTQEQVAQRVGRSRSAVANMVRLLSLPPSIQKMVQQGDLSGGHARALLGTPDRALMERLAQLTTREGLTVRQLEAEVRSATGRDDDNAAGSVEDSVPAVPSALQALPPAGLTELEDLLEEHLATRVKVQLGPKKGRMFVEFADLDDLERIYRRMTEPESPE